MRLAALGGPSTNRWMMEDRPTTYTVRRPDRRHPANRPVGSGPPRKLQGVSLRGIAKLLGISRNTVRKYVDLPAPPSTLLVRRAAHLAIQDKIGGHFP